MSLLEFIGRTNGFGGENKNKYFKIKNIQLYKNIKIYQNMPIFKKKLSEIESYDVNINNFTCKSTLYVLTYPNTSSCCLIGDQSDIRSDNFHWY